MSATLLELASTPHLMVVTDFDGTLAGISKDAYNVPINQRSIAALEAMADLPLTTVAILTGRHLEGLRQASGLVPGKLIIAGSHGAESSDQPIALTDAQVTALAAITKEFDRLADGIPGVFVEHKPYHRVLHGVRATDLEARDKAMEEALKLNIEGVTIKPGKFMVEASVTDVTKGVWIQRAIESHQPTATVFIGDDTTDEDGFKVLGDSDLAVKVGEGDTAADIRVADTDAVGDFLTELARLRSENFAAK